MGFIGRPVPDSRVTALNASPVGSVPTRSSTVGRPASASASAYTNGLDTDWIVNGAAASPAEYRRPSTVTMLKPNAAGSASASAGM